jgi:hypothetical protein
VRTHKISADVLACAKIQVHEMCARDPALEKRWLLQTVTSTETNAVGEIAKLETAHDWIVAFLTWYVGGQIARGID